MFEHYYMKGYFQLGQTVLLIVLGVLVISGAFSRRVRSGPRRWSRVITFLCLVSPFLLVDWWINQGVGSDYPTNVAIGVHYLLVSICVFIFILFTWLSFRAARRGDSAMA